MKVLKTRRVVGIVLCSLAMTYAVMTYSVFTRRAGLRNNADFSKKIADSDQKVINVTTEKNAVGEASNDERRNRPPILDFSSSFKSATSAVPAAKNPLCEVAALLGKIDIDFDTAEESYREENELNSSVNKNSTFLGNYTVANTSTAVFQGPRDSAKNQRIAIIIPFRDREHHLRICIGHLLPILRRQGNTFSIFVIEQDGNGTFNKGRVMNSGFKYAAAIEVQPNVTFDCFIFHDVDLLVENDNLIYRCSKGENVIHLSTSINKFDYQPVCCGMTVGGVLAINRDQYEKINGFSNNLWGWGGEDDEMDARIKRKRLKIARPDPELGRYTMIEHGSDKLNPYNERVYQSIREATWHMDTDGLNGLDTNIVKVHRYPTFVKVVVDVGRAPPT